MIDWLLERGGTLPLSSIFAAREGNVRLLRWLAKHGVDLRVRPNRCPLRCTWGTCPALWTENTM